MGLRSRRKGCEAELVVRDRFLAAFPMLQQLTVRRSSQAERAFESDLIIEGPNVPDWLTRLWVECEHANVPDPAKKYAQAQRDADINRIRMGRDRTPIVCWRKTASRTIWLSTGLLHLTSLLGFAQAPSNVLVTIELDEVLMLLAHRVKVDLALVA